MAEEVPDLELTKEKKKKKKKVCPGLVHAVPLLCRRLGAYQTVPDPAGASAVSCVTQVQRDPACATPMAVPTCGDSTFLHQPRSSSAAASRVPSFGPLVGALAAPVIPAAANQQPGTAACCRWGCRW